MQDVADELGEHARAALFRLENIVELGADPVERPKQRVFKPLLLTVGGDDAVHELFRAGINPARLVDRPEHEVGVFLVELPVRAHAVDLGGRGKQYALLVAHALAHDVKIGLEVELEHAQRVEHVGRGRGNRHQRQHHVAFLDVVFDPLAVDGDIALDEAEAAVAKRALELVRGHVHAVHLPVGILENALREAVADETVHAEDQNLKTHYFSPNRLIILVEHRALGQA